MVGSEALISKIMLATFCCFPAYDTYLKKGLREKNYIGKLGRNSYKQLVDLYYKEKRKTIDALSKKLRVCRIKYPVMKLIDMFFWQIGMDAERAKKKGKGS